MELVVIDNSSKHSPVHYENLSELEILKTLADICRSEGISFDLSYMGIKILAYKVR